MKLEYVNGQSSAKSHERTNMDSTGRFAVDCKAVKDSSRGSPKRAAAGFFYNPNSFSCVVKQARPCCTPIPALFS